MSDETHIFPYEGAKGQRLDKFLVDTDSEVGPVDTRNAPPRILEPGPVSLNAPDQKAQKKQSSLATN